VNPCSLIELSRSFILNHVVVIIKQLLQGARSLVQMPVQVRILILQRNCQLFGSQVGEEFLDIHEVSYRPRQKDLLCKTFAQLTKRPGSLSEVS